MQNNTSEQILLYKTLPSKGPSIKIPNLMRLRMNIGAFQMNFLNSLIIVSSGSSSNFGRITYHLLNEFGDKWWHIKENRHLGIEDNRFLI